MRLDVVHDLFEHILPQLLVHRLVHLVDQRIVVHDDVVAQVVLQLAKLYELKDHECD